VNFRVDATRTGPTHDISYYFETLPAYTIANARVGVNGGALTASLFVNNFTNKVGILTIDTMAWQIPVPSFTRPAIAQPRTVGIDVQYRFR
jgi:hypothetical protein